MQDVLDVHEQQLLMLLFVMQAEYDELGRVGVAGVDQVVHRVVDVRAVLRDFADRRAREQPALRSRVPRPDRFVVGVEEVRVRRIERRVAAALAFGVGREQEGLEEPRGVRPMPFRRTHIRHRLDHLVLVGERRGELVGEVSNPSVVIVQRGAMRRVETGTGGRHGHRSTVPKQAATHAQFRTGAIHSTTRIIGLPSRDGGRHNDGQATGAVANLRTGELAELRTGVRNVADLGFMPAWLRFRMLFETNGPSGCHRTHPL